MLTAKFNYLGGLRTRCVHVRSGSEIMTDAPVDNMGKGEAFSPTDLLATSFVSCMLTTMGIAAQKHGIEFGEATAEMEKIMAANPRRVAEIVVTIQMPKSVYKDEEREILEHAARTCPVDQSLGTGVKRSVTFLY